MSGPSTSWGCSFPLFHQKKYWVPVSLGLEVAGATHENTRVTTNIIASGFWAWFLFCIGQKPKLFKTSTESKRCLSWKSKRKALECTPCHPFLLCPCLRTCTCRDIYGALHSYSLQLRWRTLLRIKAPLGKKENSAALKAKHLPSAHNNFQNQCPISMVLASHNPSS